MTRSLLLVASLLFLAAPGFADDKPKPNTLTPQEIADGWIMLFDGETTFGWGKEGNPQVKDGNLIFSAGDKAIEVWYPVLFPDEIEIRAEWYAMGHASLAYRGPTNSSFRLPPKEHPKSQASYRRANGKFQVEVASWLSDGMPDGMGSSSPEKEPQMAKIGFIIEPNASVVVRSLQLRPLATTPLFNGKDLGGWKVFEDPKRNKSVFAVTKNGELSVKNGPGDLQTEKKFDNFVLQFDCKTNGKHLNSGIFFRCIENQYQNGYEAQIQNGFIGNDRTRPLDFGTGAIYRRVPARKVMSNDNEWFTMTVVANGPHIATWVNGYQTVDWTDDRKPSDNPRQGLRTTAGHISIQGHDPTTDLLFRNIRIAELAGEKK
jgi:hypothetical protein